MVRNALFSTVAAIGLAVPAATAGPAVVVYPAYPVVAPVCRHYTVMYRTCGREPWRSYRVYESRHGADHAAQHLQHRGFEVIVSVGKAGRDS
ncbi:MAG TPA: hypothetical protein VH120_03995 [Gemmataceae bacterium]|jgi:hypothetical protein|nr:hypothetical protein [Gemmataceae bacterium]